MKFAIQVMLNAASASSATRVICDELATRYGDTARERSKELITRVYEGFPRLSSYWNTGCGLRLQNIDAHICTNVQKRLRRVDVGCLSVHDSFIVLADHAEQLRSAMKEELDCACKELRESGFVDTCNGGLPKNLLTMWGVGGAGTGVG